MDIFAVTNSKMENDQLLKVLLQIEQLIDGVILRENSKTDYEVYELLMQLKSMGFEKEKIIVHGRPDVAVLTGINRVQLPSHGLPIPLLKKQFPTLTFGRSVHSFEEAQMAYQDGAAWLLYGHIFPSPSKVGLPPKGTEELFHIAKSIPLPTYAIGGIKPKHMIHLQNSPIAGMALMSAIFNAEIPKQTLVTYRKNL